MPTDFGAKFQELIQKLEDELSGAISLPDVLNNLMDSWNSLMNTVTTITDAKPADADRFLSDNPQAGQMTRDQFCDAVGQATADALGPQPQVIVAAAAAPTAADISAALKAVFKAVEPLIDPETYIRYVLKLQGQQVITNVVNGLESLFVAFLGVETDLDSLQWPADLPQDDAEKQKEEGLTGVAPSNWQSVASKAAPLQPLKTGAALQGQRIHRAVMRAYWDDPMSGTSHNENLVILDGRVWLDETNARISHLLDDPGALDGTQRTRLTNYKNWMVNPKTGKRVRPDIADLADTPDLEDDWGWFEIKPIGSIASAFEELYGYYLPLWNLKNTDTSSEAKPGVWFPPLLYLDRANASLAIIINTFGVIPYITIDLEAAAMAAAATAVVDLFAMFGVRLMRDISKLAEDLGRISEDIAEIVLVISAFVAVAAVVVLLLAEIIAALAIEEIAVLVGTLVKQFAQTLPQLTGAAP